MIDFKGCLDEIPDVGEYKRFRIGISNLYFWGDGYRNEKDYDDFQRIVDYLADHLDEVIQGKYFGKIYVDRKDPDSSSCSEIKSRIPNAEPAYVYLHPMEFTGMLHQEDVENLCKFINAFAKNTLDREDVTANISFTEYTYHLNDQQYMDLIFKNSKNIIARVQEYLNKLTPKRKAEWLKYGIHDVGFDFAKTCGLDRDFENRHGYSSSDTDIVAIQNIVRMAIDNGLLK